VTNEVGGIWKGTVTEFDSSGSGFDTFCENGSGSSGSLKYWGLSVTPQTSPCHVTLAIRDFLTPVSGKAVAVAAMRLRCPLERHSASEDFCTSIVTILATAGNI